MGGYLEMISEPSHVKKLTEANRRASIKNIAMLEKARRPTPSLESVHFLKESIKKINRFEAAT